MGDFDILIVGGGLAGSMVALGSARMGFNTALISPSSCFQDFRTTMLMDEGIHFLQEIELWDSLQYVSSPVLAINFLDLTGSLITAPNSIFRASEIGLDQFGYNFPNHALMTIMQKEISRHPLIHHFDALAKEIQINSTEVTTILSSGEEISGRLLIGSDGRHSHVRQKLGFGEKKWHYPQTALVLNFKHSIPHRGLCTEFHRFPGPFTQVPLVGDVSSLVWIMDPQEAKTYRELSIQEIARRIEGYLHAILGDIEIITEVQSFPLSAMVSHRFGKGRAVLVGEAAHALSPICAQGLNSSTRDAIVLLNLLKKNKVSSFDCIGDAFHDFRRGDVLQRVIGTDLLNRSLFSKYPFLQILRAGTFYALERMVPLRHQMLRRSLFLRDF
ncbi:FAD-dependent monooxygenase [Candidatus Liberibacter sp.]|uniref:FAD-dependent monooxygenase n=1 Tax=Candidatus Liberibacter sp. TaxID=34022 RepID=UPI0015F6BC16|nr:FAD-dependent monooxygenase [Candidatus Liberibacter sp.]MBA5724190.1 FAD-dependent monooxygenase [Candidatus Liberibacter sp.]